MSQGQDPSGPQFRADRPREQEAVRTTIVGGRPPGSGQQVGAIPRGIEVLIKKASIDPRFKQLLLEQRAGAAESIGLVLDPAEEMMLRAVPDEQLEAVIAQTHVPQDHRRAFLGTAAAVMLTAIGVSVPGCGGGVRPDNPSDEPVDEPDPSPTKGIRPDVPPKRPTKPKGETGSRPIEPPEEPPSRPQEIPTSKGIRPDNPPAPTGIRPD